MIVVSVAVMVDISIVLIHFCICLVKQNVELKLKHEKTVYSVWDTVVSLKNLSFLGIAPRS